MRHRSRVIVLGSNAALRIRNGALDLEHGPAAERIKLKIDIDDPKPCAILFDGRGEFITGEAVRFCARYAIDIILPNGPGRAILFTESALEATDGEALRDVGPAIIRAQCAADSVQVAQEIVRAKLAADAEGFGPRLTERDFSTITRCEARLASARSVAEIIIVEAKAASVYWRSHRDLGLIERKGGNLPRSWLRFANRGRGAEFLGNKHASHPISAMINYCIVVEAGRLARALSGFGLAFCTPTNTVAIRLCGMRLSHCGRGSMRGYSPSLHPMNLPGVIFRQAASAPIGLRRQSSPSFWRVAYRPIKTLSAARRGCEI
jgi:hypothetical protein